MKKETRAFRRTPLMRLVAGALVATGSLWLAGAQAQQAQAPNTLQRVEITGSNIKRSEAETAAPVQTITREEIERSGRATVADFLQTLSVDNQGSVPMTFGNGFAAGGSGISLRGLGAASTLVLINGRRIAPFGLADDGQKIFTDLNTIPMEAVERVEILKDGASAIYGSDAIAGVVNIILRKQYVGTAIKLTGGMSRYSDGTEGGASITYGRGDRDTDGYNFLVNFEATHKDAIMNSARAGRGFVGRTDGRTFGYDANTTIASRGAGGTGAITATNTAGSSIVGNVRNPNTNEYYSRSNQNTAQTGFTKNQPNANCATLSGNYPQGGDINGGGCLIDADQKYGEIQPSQDMLNFFTRFSKTLNANNELYAELTLFQNQSKSQTTPSGISGSTGFPGGPVSNAGVAIGATHPDNPYFGTAARFRYLAADVGPRTDDTTSNFVRALLGAKGTYGVWDYDTGLLFSQDKVKSELNGYLQRDVTFALLNPTAANVAAATAGSPAYAALPAGTVWRIAENAGLNSAALYGALSPTISHDATSKISQLDFHASREVGKLAGGPIGVAFGAEIRREETELTPTTGTDRGNIIGLGYSAYSGARTVMALYGEGLLPVTKTLELGLAARMDHYTDVGNSFTPKATAKWQALSNLALRGTYAQGFRAPGPAENGKGGLAAFGTATDPVRCALGVPNTCSAAQVALITSPNPGLKPEKSESLSAGAVWDITPRTNLALDFWQIKRKNEINQETVDSAIAAGHVSRDPSTAVMAGDPGAITAVLTNYINSSHTTVQGVDLDFRHRMDFGAQYGRVAFGAVWTHLFKWLRVDPTGASFDYAGTHGNCDVTNCMGTPADRVNLSALWDLGRWRVGGVLNYRAPMKNIAFKDDPAGCLTTFADGTDSPAGCKIASFSTVDLTVRYKLTEKTELTGIVLNLFDRIPPHDPTTYGAIGYNPLDYYGAVGRFFKVSLRHQF